MMCLRGLLTPQVWVRELAAALLQAEDRSSSMGQGSVEELIVAGVSMPPLQIPGNWNDFVSGA